MRALNNLAHEASHQLLFRNRHLNDWAGILCSAILLTRFARYRAEHLRHHALLGTQADPDLSLYSELGISDLPQRIRPLALLRAFPRRYTIHALGSTKGKAGAMERSWSSATILATGLGALALGGTDGLQAVSMYWIAPLLTSYPAIRFVAETGEHGALYQRASPSEALAHRAIAMTRNIHVHPLLAFLLYPHGDAHHMLHHRFPGIPGPCLPELQVLLQQRGWHVGIPAANWSSPLLGREGLLHQLVGHPAAPSRNPP